MPEILNQLVWVGTAIGVLFKFIKWVICASESFGTFKQS